MAVVNIYTKPFANPATQPHEVVPSELSEGKLRRLLSLGAIANGDSATSIIYFGKVPSNARLGLRSSSLHHEAITGVNDFDLGIPGQPDKLIDGADITAASTPTTVKTLSKPALADFEKPLWQLVGLADDPGGDLTIIGTLKVGATAAGKVLLELVYSLPN